jgi:hypothetical protein
MAAPTANQAQICREQLERAGRILLQAENNTAMLALPAVQAAFRETITALGAFSAYAEPVAGTVAVLNSGVLVLSPASSGVRVTGFTPTIVNGALTAIVFS